VQTKQAVISSNKASDRQSKEILIVLAEQEKVRSTSSAFSAPLRFKIPRQSEAAISPSAQHNQNSGSKLLYEKSHFETSTSLSMPTDCPQANFLPINIKNL